MLNAYAQRIITFLFLRQRQLVVRREVLRQGTQILRCAPRVRFLRLPSSRLAARLDLTRLAPASAEGGLCKVHMPHLKMLSETQLR